MKHYIYAVFLLCCSIANATAFDPTSKPITVVIPFAPGGGVDQTFRHFEKYANKKGINFVAVYRPGAEGLIGMNEIASMPKDGYHIAFGTVGTIAVQRLRNPLAEVEPVTAIRNSVSAYVAHKNSGIGSIQDLYNRQTTAGYGAPGQKMLLENLIAESKNKIDFLLIPYKGGAMVVNDISGGHIQFAAVPLSIAKGQIDNGAIRLLAVGSAQRLKEYPHVPTIFSVFPRWQDVDAFAFVLPKDTTSSAEQFWSLLLKEYMADKSVQADFVNEFNELNEFGKQPLSKLIANAMKSMSK